MNTTITINGGFLVRPANEIDFPLLAETYNAYAGAAGLNTVSESFLRRPLIISDFDIENDSKVVLSSDGRIAGFAILDNTLIPPVFPTIRGCVHPDFEDRGIGTYLLDWAEDRAKSCMDRVPEGVRIALRCYCSDFHRPSKRLLADNKFRVVRSYKNMRMVVTHGSPSPEWPDGIQLCTFKEHPDLAAVYRTIDESFRDHWGYVAQDENAGLQQWQRGFIDDALFDPTIWFLLMEDKEVVAAALCSEYAGNDADTGYVIDLGVRKPWRRKGLALNLLYHIFGEFQSRGKKYVRLTVDSTSLTGANRLYEIVGMVPVLTRVLYEKQMRGGVEPSAVPVAKPNSIPATVSAAVPVAKPNSISASVPAASPAEKPKAVPAAIPITAADEKKPEIEYIESGVKNLDTIKPLWEKLNEHHRRLSQHFAVQIAQLIFEERKKAIENKSKPQQHISLARDRATDIVIGYCVSSISNEEQGEIESIYVEADYRKKGIGDALMHRALAWLDKKKVKRIIVGVASGNEEVFGFYGRYGFYPRTTILQQSEPVIENDSVVPHALNEHQGKSKSLK